jgi:16S rRNA processing protein RimM
LKFSNSPEIPDGLILIGKVVGAHGIRGAIRVYSYAESPEIFAPGGDICLIDPAGQSVPYRIVWATAYKQVVRLALTGLDTREAAQALAGRLVCMAKLALPPLAPETYYWSDLIGMAVHTVAGEYLGQVVQIIPTGANDVYVVKTPAGHPVDEILVPAIASVVLEIDVPQRRMQVDLPEGLI